jgi:hypothetical protein
VLSAFEDAFVQLAADARLRRELARDPDGALAAFALDARERAVLRAIPHAELERFARTLVAKRWGDVARVVPLTLRIAPDLGARYRAWALEHPARASDGVLAPGVAEALRALGPLCEQLPAVAADLLAFEVLRAASRGDGEPRRLRSRFAVHEPEPREAPHDYLVERERVRWRSP